MFNRESKDSRGLSDNLVVGEGRRVSRGLLSRPLPPSRMSSYACTSRRWDKDWCGGIQESITLPNLAGCSSGKHSAFDCGSPRWRYVLHGEDGKICQTREHTTSYPMKQMTASTRSIDRELLRDQLCSLLILIYRERRSSRGRRPSLGNIGDEPKASDRPEGARLDCGGRCHQLQFGGVARRGLVEEVSHIPRISTPPAYPHSTTARTSIYQQTVQTRNSSVKKLMHSAHKHLFVICGLRQ